MAYQLRNFQPGDILTSAYVNDLDAKVNTPHIALAKYGSTLSITVSGIEPTQRSHYSIIMLRRGASKYNQQSRWINMKTDPYGYANIAGKTFSGGRYFDPVPPWMPNGGIVQGEFPLDQNFVCSNAQKNEFVLKIELDKWIVDALKPHGQDFIFQPDDDLPIVTDDHYLVGLSNSAAATKKLYFTVILMKDDEIIADTNGHYFTLALENIRAEDDKYEIISQLHAEETALRLKPIRFSLH